MKSIVCGFLLFVLLTSAVGITAATDSQYPSSTVEFKDPEGKYTIKFTFPDNDNTPHQYGVGYVKGIGYEMCETEKITLLKYWLLIPLNAMHGLI